MSAKVKGYLITALIAVVAMAVVERDLIPGVRRIVKGA